MKQSQLATKTRRYAPKDEVSKNARLLIQAGFIHKELAGVYSYLPLGLKVLEKVKNIIREEIDAVGGQEISLSALQKPEIWQSSGRWSDEVVDDWFKTKLKNETDLGLAFTHEEPLTAIMKDHISSYRDLPVYLYQFQTKFRNELRAKSGIMRGREFLMKDLYDFSLNKKDHLKFYEEMKGVYQRIFNRVGIGQQTYMTASSGGSFAKYSFEFQTLSEAGEDTILLDLEKKFAVNKQDYSPELLADFGLKEEECNFQEVKAIEVGDIYTLGDKFSRALNLTYKDQKGQEHFVFMGCYGIGIPRLIGTVVELHSDDKGIIWPQAIAPFDVHLLQLSSNEEVKRTAEELYQTLKENGVEVLYDDRDESAGVKFTEADIIGLPYRLVISEKNVTAGEIELQERRTGKVSNIDEAQVLDTVLKLMNNNLKNGEVAA